MKCRSSESHRIFRLWARTGTVERTQFFVFSTSEITHKILLRWNEYTIKHVKTRYVQTVWIMGTSGCVQTRYYLQIRCSVRTRWCAQNQLFKGINDLVCSGSLLFGDSPLLITSVISFLTYPIIIRLSIQSPRLRSILIHGSQAREHLRATQLAKPAIAIIRDLF